MRILYINGSPKKKLSVSNYLIGVQKFFTGGKSVKEQLRNRGDHERILGEMKDVDTIVFCLPLYVDGVPSHVLDFMKNMEVFCKQQKKDLTVYVISNCGFIEGNQNRPLFQVFENFCARCNVTWGGGFGIGGGVMLNVIRIMFLVYAAIFGLNLVASGLQSGNWFPMNHFFEFLEQTVVILFFNLGVFLYSILLGQAIRKRKSAGVKFTRILIPSFIFIVCADIFFMIISVFQGGLFKGWLSKK